MSVAAPEASFLEFLPDDVIVMRPWAKDAQDLEATAERLKSRAEQARFFLIVDFSGLDDAVDASIRKKGPDVIKAEWMRGAVYVNASMPIRAGLKVINLAMFLAGRASFPTEYAKSLEEAHAIVARFRAEGN